MQISTILRSAIVLTTLLIIAANASTTSTDDDAIRAVLAQQVKDWNRGDLDAFAAGYKKSPDILFVGRETRHGYDAMLASYRQHYPTPAKMGTLSFTHLEVQSLDEHFATVTGYFHLERSLANDGNADGYFLLVVEKTGVGWKIVRDDTTAIPASAAH